MRKSLWVSFWALAFATCAIAQTSTVSSVTVVASDPLAVEPGPTNLNTGTFRITRSGPTNMPLVVFFTLSGTAQNGVDYEQRATTVTIPENARAAEVSIVPLDDTLVEGDEQVILRLVPSQLMAPVPGYIVGTNSTFAVVVIRDNDLPPPPDRNTVTIVAVDPEASEVDPRMNVPIGADTALLRVVRSGPTHFPITVRYEVGGTASPGADYLGLSGEAVIPEGAHSADIVVRAMDDFLVEPTETVEVTVVPPICPAIEPPPPECYLVGTPNKATAFIRDNDQPPTNNFPPMVQIVRPPDGSQFRAPAEIHIVADTVDHDGWVGKVEFFANSNKIGESVITFVIPPTNGTPISHEFTWIDARPGQYRLQARAIDDDGVMRMSAPVFISVTDSNTIPPRPVVTIVAVDPEGGEPRLGYHDVSLNPAVLRIIRSGPTDFPLTVFYQVGGTAENGADYARLSGEAVIPLGAHSTDIVINPIDDQLVEPTETVEVTVVPPACVAIEPPPRECYLVGTPGKAVAFIVDNDQTDPPPTNNLPPMVHIVRPPTGSIFKAPAEIHIVADTMDRDGWVGKVEFFANSNKIGESTITFVVAPPDGTPISHEFTWTDVRAGQYMLRARATDDEGATTMSFPVNISVTESNALPPRTVVTIAATDPEGSEIPEVPPGMERPQLIDPAIFTVRRTGILSNALTVHYTIGGTAANGVDYVEIPRAVRIAENESSAEIEINVIDDRLVEGPESVVITLQPAPCFEIFPPPPECYVVGIPGRAEARIRDNDFDDTNRPPVVSIVAPTNGAVFVAPADIHIIAQAFDSDGFVHTVQFFANSNSLGIVTNNPLAMNIMNPFQLNWEDVPPGFYMLTALATDNDGAQSRSFPVRVSVIEEPVRQTVVNIRAVDPEAAEQDPRLDSLQNNALLKVTRSGPTDFDLPVFYHLGGTAQNGVDYVELKGEVVIPTGSEFADIVIEAIDDKLSEPTESVLVTVVPPVCPRIWPPPRECYVVGSAGRAMAFILDDEPFETNHPPHVEIVRPPSGSIFHAPATVHIVANTIDRDGYVGKVEFFANDHKIGEASKQFLVPPPDGEPIQYDFEWKDVRPGFYALTARGIDDQGAPGLSAPVRISVVGTNEPPPTNVAVVTVYAIDAHASEGPIIWLTNEVGVVQPYGLNSLGTNTPPPPTNMPPIPDPTNIVVRPYTNTATFEIRRSGNLDSSLRVFYEMHGTASEGVDYLDLPGIAEIPVGHRAARVVVMPIDDRLAERYESVIICLRPSPVASILPTYVVGRPGQAAAVIADNDMPRPSTLCLRDGTFHWCVPAETDVCYRIECSRDLKEWTELSTMRAAEGAIYYVDAEALAHDRGFYRLVPVPCPSDAP